MTEEKEQELIKQCKNDVAEIVLKYAQSGMDPDIVVSHLLMAAMKVSHARCLALLKQKENDDQIIKDLGGVDEA